MVARILVADDELDIRRLVTFTLQRRGHDVLPAANGDEAIALTRRERPDLIVLDVMMPGRGGLDVTRELAADPATASIPVILLSALGQAGEVAAGLATGARAYLVKPFAPADLADRVGAILATVPGV
jgi:DNA-binding response OmpR family regulator